MVVTSGVAGFGVGGGDDRGAEGVEHVSDHRTLLVARKIRFSCPSSKV